MALTYEDIRQPFLDAIANDREAQALLEIINSGQGTYETCSAYAARIGDCLASVLRMNAPLTGISEWNIEDLIPRSLGLDQEIITQACQVVQDELYLDAGLGIRYQAPRFDNNRAWGLVDELRNNPEFTNIEASFYDQLTNFSQNVVDESIRTNANRLYNAGVKSIVIRRPDFRACDWCREVAGTFDYSEVKATGNDVWRRHENCRCTIDYMTEKNGSRWRERVNNYRRIGSSPRRTTSSTSTTQSSSRSSEYYDQILDRLIREKLPANATEQQIRAYINNFGISDADRQGLLEALRRRRG